MTILKLAGLSITALLLIMFFMQLAGINSITFGLSLAASVAVLALFVLMFVKTADTDDYRR